MRTPGFVLLVALVLVALVFLLLRRQDGPSDMLGRVVLALPALVLVYASAFTLGVLAVRRLCGG